MVHEPTPAARIATISLSLPMREKPMMIPASVARGIEKMSTPGNSAAPMLPSSENGRSA